MKIHDLTRKAINETADLISEKGHILIFRRKYGRIYFRKI